MMIASKKAIDMIKAFEGFRAKPYSDSGNTAIGYGHTIHAGPPVPEDDKIIWDDLHAEMMLDLDIKLYAQSVDEAVNVPVSQGQFDALVVWVYNLGVKAMKKSRWLMELNAGNYEKVPELMKCWHHDHNAKGQLIDIAGLVKRREAEAELFKSSPIGDTMQ